ncbi:sigma-70 family RNA polymerase sigma factor [Amycolatopsis sp. NPDC004169]|uniref:RNA polymerase sigma factor n=1 Tax=Amycolatopsis sp. NPDC004169 TaxID=3154453 RepID=UPI0033A5C906
MPEDDLIGRLQAGDAAASAALLELCQGKVRKYLTARLPNAADVDDCVSEIVTRALEAIRANRPPRSLDPWLIGIASNVLKERYRENDRVRPFDDLGELSYVPDEPYLELAHAKIDIEDLVSVPADLETIISKRDLWAILPPAIESLGGELQRLMKEHVRLSIERDTLVTGAELAAALDLPVSIVKVQLQRARQLTRDAIVALVLAHSGRADCPVLDSLLANILSPEQQNLHQGLVLTADQCVVIFRHAFSCPVCVHRAQETDFSGFSIPSSTGSPHREPAPSDLPISIYLSDEAIHEEVQNAVEDLVTQVGGWIADADEPILGSWFRRLRAKVRLAARTPKGRELAHVAAHAAEARLVLSQDATITATMLQNLGPVLTALQPTKEAVIRVGALLIVKVDGVVGVHQLTSAQQFQLDHQPGLAMAPHEILTALQLGPGDPPPECP